MKTKVLLPVLLVLLVITFLASVAFGSTSLGFSDTLLSIFKPSMVKASTVYIVRNIRLPRALAAITTGSLLALCGLIFQTVFRNPMADSYILGISSGASCFVALGLLLGIGMSSFSIPVFALIGSLLSSLFLFYTGRKNIYSLLLSGIAVNFFLSAATTLIIHLGNRQVDAILYWTMGSLSNCSWSRIAIMGSLGLVLIFFMEKNSSKLDIILLDDSTAISSGIDLKKTRVILLMSASLITAIVVSFCGVIGFVGLMSPHIARILCGPKHKKIIPSSFLMGSLVLLLSDLLSRVLLAPSELPVGVVTSILGSPLFFILLKRRSK